MWSWAEQARADRLDQISGLCKGGRSRIHEEPRALDRLTGNLLHLGRVGADGADVDAGPQVRIREDGCGGGRGRANHVGVRDSLDWRMWRRAHPAELGPIPASSLPKAFGTCSIGSRRSRLSRSYERCRLPRPACGLVRRRQRAPVRGFRGGTAGQQPRRQQRLSGWPSECCLPADQPA